MPVIIYTFNTHGICGVAFSGDTQVTYLDYGNTEIVFNSVLKPYAAAPAHLLVEGAHVRAINPADGLFYDANIEAYAASHSA